MVTNAYGVWPVAARLGAVCSVPVDAAVMSLRHRLGAPRELGFGARAPKSMITTTPTSGDFVRRTSVFRRSGPPV